MPRLVGWRSMRSCGSGQAADLGLVHGSVDLVWWEDAGEVELGAGCGGDGDPVAGGDLVGWENGSVKEESGSRVCGSVGW